MSRFKDGLAGHLAIMSLGAKFNDNSSVIGVTVANMRTQLDELKGELSSLPDAKEISLSDKKSELAKLVASVDQAQQQLDLGKKEVR